MNQTKVSIQGQRASYHHLAAIEFFGRAAIDVQERTTFSEVFEDVVAQNHCDYGIVAIENSSVGSINEVYDLLRKSDLYIVGEHYRRVSHCLIGFNTATIKDITDVYSHPMALLQCENFLEENLSKADIHERHDTAESVDYIKKLQDKTQAAIASRQAADLYDMSVLAEDIETDKHNYTRFLILKKHNHIGDDVNKTTIIVELTDKPGSLYHALGCFEKEGINLSKIESRPILGRGWRYYFYIDFEAGINDERTKRALNKLDKQGHDLTVLGSYKKGESI